MALCFSAAASLPLAAAAGIGLEGSHPHSQPAADAAGTRPALPLGGGVQPPAPARHTRRPAGRHPQQRPHTRRAAAGRCRIRTRVRLRHGCRAMDLSCGAAAVRNHAGDQLQPTPAAARRLAGRAGARRPRRTPRGPCVSGTLDPASRRSAWPPRQQTPARTHAQQEVAACRQDSQRPGGDPSGRTDAPGDGERCVARTLFLKNRPAGVATKYS